MASKILIIEDEADLAIPLAENLRDEGYHVEIAMSGEEGRRKVVDHWDLVILDLMLPDLSGEALLNYYKQQSDYAPVLILTARSSLQDKLQLFQEGCDDYLTKPYIYEELRERVRALLRRSQRVRKQKFLYEDMSLDPSTFTLIAGESSTVLTPKEASILSLFLGAPGRVISRKEILENVWGLSHESDTNFIGVHLFNLRKKLTDLKRGSWLQTIRSSGFVFIKPESI
ncbi:MAG: DNA-binding response regulator [Proteobacteria bacterium]|nr:DNA-binding response regulator [Pseudomonadota bacterium]NDC23525.1 DNA-binding response regulator [Pseudomonadota bacterium]NDD03706.1 DNA-binding response regulator [Pseudomonadota bacterium]NDG26202.1 DNA-binding response regulator [Pseudomonadota bacterium]